MVRCKGSRLRAGAAELPPLHPYACSGNPSCDLSSKIVCARWVLAAASERVLVAAAVELLWVMSGYGEAHCVDQPGKPQESMALLLSVCRGSSGSKCAPCAV